jgi:hypothetical protein
LSSSWTHINNLIRLHSGQSVVLNVDDRPRQISKSRDKTGHIGGMLTYRRLIENMKQVF